MQEILLTNTMRASDEETIRRGTPAKELMRRAACALAEKGRFASPVGIFCGGGNNGGDGFALALELKKKGIPAELILLKEPAAQPAGSYYLRCQEEEIPCLPFSEDLPLEKYATLADCLLGTGFTGPVRGMVKEAIEAMNRSGIPVISTDIPSGISGENGLGEPAVQAAQTISIGAYQPGHFLGRAKDLRGELMNADIGIEPVHIDAFLMEEKDAAAVLPGRPHFSHKGKYGYIVLAGGSVRYSGAPRLANLAAAAMRSGAGVVTAAAPKSLIPLLAAQTLESTLFPLSETEAGGLLFIPEEWEQMAKRADALAFGMGAGLGPETEKTVGWLLEHYEGKLVLDADALTALAACGADRLDKTQARVVLTPHLGEAARLMGRTVRDIEKDPLGLAKEFAAAHHCTVLLKGAATVVTDGEESVLTDRGAPGMATAGSGDVLSGVLTALLGYSEVSSVRTAAAAAYLCGMAGEYAQEESGATAMIASDTASCLRRAVRRLEILGGHMTV